MPEREQPEPREPAPITPEVLKDVLNALPEHQMVQFADDGVRIYGFIETGETRNDVFRVGEATMSFSVPVREPLIQREAASITDLIQPHGEPIDLADPPDWFPSRYRIDGEAFAEWKRGFEESMPALEAAARKIVESRPPGFEQESTLCSNCKGKCEFESPCTCKEGGFTHVDLETDESFSEREPGEPDPDCGTCHGSGQKKSDCPVCRGAGTLPKYPTLTMVNEITGEEREIVMDIAGLINEGSLGVDIRVEEMTFQTFNKGDEDGSCSYQLEWRDFISNQARELGIDVEHTMIRSVPGYLRQLGEVVRDEALHHSAAYWEKKEGVITTIPPKYDMEDSLEEAQRSLARTYAFKHPKDETPLGEVRMVFHPVRPAVETLADLRGAIEAAGYRLSFGRGFIATEESGPAFFVTDQHGGVVAELSAEHDVRTSLENAWSRFEGIRGQLNDSEEE
jgi:hypothetical protein